VFEPVRLSSERVVDVVEAMCFATERDGEPHPGLNSTWLVHPSVVETSTVGPILPTFMKIDMRVWLGRGSHTPGEIAQQWSLPGPLVRRPLDRREPPDGLGLHRPAGRTRSVSDWARCRQRIT
jgi:hypothetical protein